jgi:hypothetical protein
MKKNIIHSLINEYGLKWTLNRALYSSKLKMLTMAPFTELIFERNVEIKRLDLFEFNLTTLQSFLEKLSDEKKEEIITIADKAIDGKIMGFSSIELDYGSPINWHYNPLTGFKSEKDVKWYRIPDFDTNLGDIKVIWEASRFTHLFYFIRAYILTHNKKYYDAFSFQIHDWLENNTYSYGANFKCGQECSLRMINVLWAYSVFKQYGLTSKADEDNVKKLVKVCYKKVLSNFFYAHKCIRNNHTFSEICGLIVGAWCSDNNSHVKKAYELLDKEIVNQFLPDGGFTQYSFNYHRFTLQIIACVYSISKKTQMYITEASRILESVKLLYQVQSESGDVPNYGSNDGALIFPVTSCGYRDYRPVLNTVFALIEGKRLYTSGDYDEELLWFGSELNLPFKNIKRQSSQFNDSGYYILRDHTSFLLTCLQQYKSRPGHMDQLHIDLWQDGKNLLCDNGTYSYASSLGKELSSTISHNTVSVAKKEQMNKVSTFLVIDWTTRDAVSFNENNFEGTLISKNNYKHTRSLEKSSHGYSMTDEVIGEGEYCESYFHSPYDIKLIESGFQIYDEERLLCTVKTNGEVSVSKAYRSLFYLKKEEINRIIVKSKIVGKTCKIDYALILHRD